MGLVILKSLSILLGLFFIFVGILKITCLLNKDLHRDLRKEYVKYAKVFPLTHFLAVKIPAKWYRKVIGCLEIACGIALTLIPREPIKKVANIILILIMFLSVYSHFMVNEKFERIAPALVFFFMLVGRMIIAYQIEKQTQDLSGEIKTVKQE